MNLLGLSGVLDKGKGLFGSQGLTPIHLGIIFRFRHQHVRIAISCRLAQTIVVTTHD